MSNNQTEYLEFITVHYRPHPFFFVTDYLISRPDQNIMCFGDSITRSDGGGTNYPTYLNELLVQNN
ncbi:hypothetical protein [Formosa sp. L2A11]|uniref:hypothetical protein n=1 Tax=Formosa sp. L2A11 TaxID=2686363 RepID=UPI00131B6B53|nr:hypothetical protein [Formosa sp. L2A11]